MTNEEIEAALLHLYEIGAVKVSYDENLEARFEITEEGINHYNLAF